MEGTVVISGSNPNFALYSRSPNLIQLKLGAWNSKHMMGEINSPSSSKHYNDGPNYFAYYKHLVLDQISQNDDYFGEETKDNFAVGNGIKLNDLCDSSPIFTEAVGKGLPDFKKERLLGALNESVVCLNREINEMADNALATLHIESTQKQVSKAKLNEDEGLMSPFNLKKRKSPFLNTKRIGCNTSAAGQVCNSIQILQGNYEVSLNDSEKYKHDILVKLDSMSINLEEYLNTIVSKFRPMTIIEKHQLGKLIRKLPEAAFDRVVEILQPSIIFADASPERRISVDLDEQDNVKLWRLYYYVELVLKTNKL